MTTHPPTAAPPPPGRLRRFWERLRKGVLWLWKRVFRTSPKSENTDKADAEAKAKADAEKRDLIRRIPLHEVLSEEYGMRDPSKVDPKKTLAEREALKWRRGDLEKRRGQLSRDQLRLEEEELDFEEARIKFEEARQARLQMKRKKSTDKREQASAEKQADDEITRAFFTMLAREQRYKAGKKFQRLKDEAPAQKSGDEAPARKREDDASRAAINHVYGITRDEEERRKWKNKKLDKEVE